MVLLAHRYSKSSDTMETLGFSYVFMLCRLKRWKRSMKIGMYYVLGLGSLHVLPKYVLPPETSSTTIS